LLLHMYIMDDLFMYPETIHENAMIDISDVDMDIVSELLSTSPCHQELTNITFDIEDILNPTTTNNNHIKNTKPVIVRQEPPECTSYTSIQQKRGGPESPSGSWISTDDFPEELDDLEPYESGIDSDETVGKFTKIFEGTVPVFNVEHADDEEETEDTIEEITSEDSDTNHLRPPVRNLQRQGSRMRKRLRRVSPDSTDSESDPDFDPEDFEEEEERSVRKKISSKIVKREQTSDYESEECDQEKTMKRQRRPSKNPIPQQRKKGSKQKISQWIVSLLRNPETNPSVITWEDEPKGKFRVTDSVKYAQLWGVIKRNPNMNYEKLSRAMRYYYRNKEISMVKGERLTYAFGPNMRDFHAKNKADPNFDWSHSSKE